MAAFRLLASASASRGTCNHPIVGIVYELLVILDPEGDSQLFD